MAEVVLEHVVKEYAKGAHIIDNVSLTIPDNQLTVFVGPSGCGKSTLLKLIAGLEDVSSGTMKINGEVVTDQTPSERGIAMVFQSYALYPHMTVFENMAFALKIAKADKASIDERVNRVAKILQLDHLLTRKPRQLSGGQRQRVAIGRALVREPKVFLLDEPLSNLDAALRVDMRLEIAKIRRDLGATMIYVTHDQVEAMTLADRIVVLRQGHVEQVGAPLEIYRKPVNRFVAGFLGSPSMNFIEVKLGEYNHDRREARVTIAGQSADIRVKATLPAETTKGSTFTLGVRPEHLDIVPANKGEKNAIEGTLDVIENLGDHAVLYVDVAGSKCVLKVDADFHFNRGDKILFSPRLEDCHIFDQNGANLSLDQGATTTSATEEPRRESRAP